MVNFKFFDVRTTAEPGLPSTPLIQIDLLSQMQEFVFLLITVPSVKIILNLDSAICHISISSSSRHLRLANHVSHFIQVID